MFLKISVMDSKKIFWKRTGDDGRLYKSVIFLMTLETLMTLDDSKRCKMRDFCNGVRQFFFEIVEG